MRRGGMGKRSRVGLLGKLLDQEKHGTCEAAAGKLGGMRGSSGGGGATWRGEERANAGWVSSGAVLEGTWRREERRGGSWGSENGRRRRRGHGREAEQGEGLEVEDKD
jgi:hypothetical protein